MYESGDLAALARRGYRAAIEDGAPPEDAELLVRCVLVMRGVVDPLASELARAARQEHERPLVAAFRCAPGDVDESAGLAQ